MIKTAQIISKITDQLVSGTVRPNNNWEGKGKNETGQALKWREEHCGILQPTSTEKLFYNKKQTTKTKTKNTHKTQNHTHPNNTWFFAHSQNSRAAN